ncbi:MAG: DUF2971 domain-containing protein [Pyrinomonadaceae bacterium]
MILYKYLSPENAEKVIRTGCLRFTQPSQFNDIFDLRPHYQNLNEASAIKSAVTTDNIRAETETFFDDLLSGFPPEMKQSFYEHADLKSAVPIAKEFMRSLFDGFTDVVRKKMFENLDKLAGVLCLSEAPDSNLMWATYGSEHKGVCFGFDSENPYFNRRKSETDELRHLVKVDYLPERAQVQVLEEETGHKILYSKTEAWSAEREWRMLHALPDADVVVDTEPPVYLFRFNPDCLREIIFGCRIPDEVKNQLRKAIDEGLNHVKVYQVRPDDVTDQLHIDEIG